MTRGGRLLRAVAAGLLTAVVCGAASCEELGTASVTARHELTFGLSAEDPWVVRALRFRAVPGGQEVTSIRTSVSSDDRGDGFAAANVWVSVVDPEDGGFVMDLPAVQAGLQTAVNASTDCPIESCDERWLVIARLIGPASDETVDAVITAALMAYAGRDTGPDGPFALDVLEVAEVDVPQPTPVRLAHASVSGRWRIGTGDEQIVRHYLVEVDDTVRAAARESPLIARIAFFPERTASSGTDIFLTTAITRTDEPGAGELAIGGRSVREVDLIALCEDRDPCRVPLTVTWSIIARVAGTSPGPSDWAESRWWLAATVEGDPSLNVPSDAVRITETTEPANN